MTDERFDMLIREKYILYYERKTIFKEESIMNVMVKHIVEIAGGLVLGGLASDALNKAVEASKKAVKNIKKK